MNSSVPAPVSEPRTPVETAFSKLTGRRATAEERERLYRLRDALHLEDNDAFWAIVMALDHYDSFFRAYPAQLAAVTDRVLERVEAAAAASAEHEVALVQRALADRVAEESVVLARKMAERPVGLHGFSAALVAVVAFGAICMTAGYRQAVPPGVSPALPPRAPPWELRDAVGWVLAMPAGWMIFALLMPAAIHGGRIGWSIANDDAADRRSRALGWSLVVVSIIGLLACAALVAKVS